MKPVSYLDAVSETTAVNSNLIQAFRHGATPYRGVSFPGFQGPTFGLSKVLEPRGVARFNVKTGDLVHITSHTALAPVVMAFGDTGEPALNALALSADHELETTAVDGDALTGWLVAQGTDANQTVPAHRVQIAEEPVVLRASSAVTLWFALPTTQDALVLGETGGTVTIDHRPAPSNVPLLPPPLGAVRDEFTIPRGTAMAYELAAGESVQIIDIEGQQCSDFTSFRTAGLQAGREEMMDATVTRSMARSAYPMPGLFDKYYDAAMRPMLQKVQDTVGRHDTFALACTARGYEERGFPGHVNCSDNISDALGPHGVAARPAWPAINLFFNSWIDRADNALQSDEAWSRAGDYVLMRALDNLTCVSTACPDDIDPINGWNPTDVHVRIYRENTPIQRAVAYRETEKAVPDVSEESAFHPRTSTLTKAFQPARNIWAPTHFPTTGAIGEYWACRNAVTLQDMSALRKFDIKGPDAERLLQWVTTRDVARLPVYRGTYALICDEMGQVVDDGTLFRLAPDLFRWCCGSEESGRIMAEHVAEHGLRVRVEAMRGALPSLALQGPKSRDLLREIVHTAVHVPALDDLKWFGATIGRLHDREGAPFFLTRTGYTGELGYELFMARADAVSIWDALMEAGKPFGIKPMGGAALDMLRIEAGLMAAGAEFAPGVDAFEAGLGFAVSMKKAAFLGRDALERNAAAPRRKLIGMLFDGDEVAGHGDTVFVGERPVGLVTSATRSPTLERGIAMARVAVEWAESGTDLEVGRLDGRMKRFHATATTIPFVDPKRERPRA